MTPQKYTIPASWITVRHAAFVGLKNGQVDVVLACDEDSGEHYLLQVVGGKSATIRQGQGAVDSFASVISNAPGVVEFSTFPWVGQAA